MKKHKQYRSNNSNEIFWVTSITGNVIRLINIQGHKHNVTKKELLDNYYEVDEEDLKIKEAS